MYTDFRQPHARLAARYKDNLNHLRVIRKLLLLRALPPRRISQPAIRSHAMHNLPANI
jgi:hypothetical protein